jgi:hypothetical protein
MAGVRAEATALEAFWDCPYLEQTVHISPALAHDTPCRHEACIRDSDSCECLHYQNIYCSQPAAGSQDGSCVRGLFLTALANCPPAGPESVAAVVSELTAELAAEKEAHRSLQILYAQLLSEVKARGSQQTIAPIEILDAEVAQTQEASASEVVHQLRADLAAATSSL